MKVTMSVAETPRRCHPADADYHPAAAAAAAAADGCDDDANALMDTPKPRPPLAITSALLLQHQQQQHQQQQHQQHQQQQHQQQRQHKPLHARLSADGCASEDSFGDFL